VNQAPPDKVAAARARMAELAAKFVERSANDLDSMRDDLAKLRAGDMGAVRGIHHLAHRMCGTGATLGFEGLSECAARLERLAESCPPDTLPEPALLTKLEVGVEALGAELARLRSR
jgi:HPt (histidine-containing phosphotransfer) domain-containing protein